MSSCHEHYHDYAYSQAGGPKGAEWHNVVKSFHPEAFRFRPNDTVLCQLPYYSSVLSEDVCSDVIRKAIT